MIKRLTTAVLSLLLAVVAVPATAGQGNGAACTPTRAGLSELGYSAFRDGATIRGISADLLTEIQRRSGCPVSLEWYPHGRLYAQFFNGQLDLTGASLRTPERDRYGRWLPYSYTHFELLLVKQRSGKFRSLADFVDHSTARLNVTRGVTYSAATMVQMERLQKLGRLEYVKDYNVVFRKIAAGRAEGTLAPPAIHVLHQRQAQLLGKMTAMPMSESPRTMIGLYVSHQVPAATLQRYAEALRTIIADGTLQKFYVRYLGAEITEQIFADGVPALLSALPKS